jgi:hypothetical protein
MTVGFAPWSATLPRTRVSGWRFGFWWSTTVNPSAGAHVSYSRCEALRSSLSQQTGTTRSLLSSAPAQMDVNLPGRDGYAVAVSLASVCSAARIVLTSSDLDDVPTAVLDECGATAFVPKTELATVDLLRLFNGGG